jgi:hypothetical protein
MLFYNPEDFFVDLVVVLLVVAYFIIWLMGKLKNSAHKCGLL